MNASRIMWINGGLFVLILALSVMIITQERILPGEPPVKEARRQVIDMINQDAANPRQNNETFPSLGKTNLFETIIPLPTPTPAPSPTPPKPPRINEVTEFWKLAFVMNSMAQFQHIKTEQDFMVKLGEAYSETYRGQSYNIYLESVDRKNWTATVMMNEQGEIQKRTFKMFE